MVERHPKAMLRFLARLGWLHNWDISNQPFVSSTQSVKVQADLQVQFIQSLVLSVTALFCLSLVVLSSNFYFNFSFEILNFLTHSHLNSLEALEVFLKLDSCESFIVELLLKCRDHGLACGVGWFEGLWNGAVSVSWVFLRKVVYCNFV